MFQNKGLIGDDNLYNKGDTPFAKDNLAYDEATGIYKRGNVQIDPNNADFKFPLVSVFISFKISDIFILE